MDETKTGMQAAFDTATAAIIKQGKRSVSYGGTCQYRGPDGMKCAVGHLMTDEQIARHHISNSATAFSFKIPLMQELIPGLNDQDEIEVARSFLAELQDAHDLAYTVSSLLSSYKGFVADFSERANKVAVKYDLTPIKR
jgi:hypothetical protein